MNNLDHRNIQLIPDFSPKVSHTYFHCTDILGCLYFYVFWERQSQACSLDPTWLHKNEPSAWSTLQQERRCSPSLYWAYRLAWDYLPLFQTQCVLAPLFCLSMFFIGYLASPAALCACSLWAGERVLLLQAQKRSMTLPLLLGTTQCRLMRTTEVGPALSLLHMSQSIALISAFTGLSLATPIRRCIRQKSQLPEVRLQSW